LSKRPARKIETISDAAARARELAREVFEAGVEARIEEFEKQFTELVSSLPEFMPLDLLPQKVEAKVMDVPQIKLDKRNNEALFIRLITRDNKMIVQKYGKSSWPTLLEVFNKCGGLRKLMTDYYTWIKKPLGRMQRERLIPVCE